MSTARGPELEARLISERAESRRVRTLQTLALAEQARLGQFFTPAPAADLIASVARLGDNAHLRVLDPGAGSGSLSAAVASRVLRERPDISLEIVAVELDEAAIPSLRETLNDIEQSYARVGATVETLIIHGDFINLMTGILNRVPALDAAFNLVVMNPPYRKLGANSTHRQALSRQGAECPNLYAAFLALGVDALANGGQLAAITPRSFANGPYFSKFRSFLLARLALDHLHVFESRSTVFSDTGVLQETVIFSGTRNGERNKVRLSTSHGHRDTPVEKVVNYDEVVRPSDPHRFIRIATAESDTSIVTEMDELPATLQDLAIAVSTGKVVDFRSRDRLTIANDAGAVPLVYPGNVRGGLIEWPREIRKAQGFLAPTESDPKLLMPRGYYVVVKRFSSKEERRRVVAGVWDPTQWDGPVAFENHLNVFHASGVGLGRDVAVGLSYWLNSSLVDTFFRTFSGHTQVNATDLRSLRYPSLADLARLGSRLEPNLPDQAELDQIVQSILGIRVVAA